MVTYDPIPGRIYDITFIVTALCDYEGYASFYKLRVDEQGLSGITLDIYEFVRKYDVTISDDIGFLFRYNFNNEHRFIGNYLRESGAYTIFDSVNSFIEWIRNLSSDLLLPSFYRYLDKLAGEHLGNLKLGLNSSSGDIYSYVTALDLEPRWKLAVLSVLLDTPAFVSKLADVLVRCEAILKDINIHFQDYIRVKENRKHDVQDLKHIWGNAYPNTGIVDLEDTIYSFSFLNDFMVLHMDRFSPVCLILGCNAEDCHTRSITKGKVNIVLAGKAVGDENRFRILKLLEDRPMYATELAAELKIAHTSLFYHVNLLYEAGLINVSVQGRKTYYSINEGQIGKLSRYIADYHKRLVRRKTTCGRSQ